MSYQVSQVWKMLDSPPATLQRSQTTHPSSGGIAGASVSSGVSDKKAMRTAKSTSALLSAPEMDASSSTAASSDDGGTDVEDAAESRTASAISSLMSLSSMVTSGLSYATANPTAALAYTSDSVLGAASMLTSTTTESTLFLVHFCLSLLDLLRGKVVEELCMALLSLVEKLIKLLRLDQTKSVIVSVLALLKTAEMIDLVDSSRRVLAALFAVLRTEEIKQFRNRVWRTLQFVRKIAGKETDRGGSKQQKKVKKKYQSTDDGSYKNRGEKERRKHNSSDKGTITAAAADRSSSKVTPKPSSAKTGGSRRQSWIGSMLSSVYGDDPSVFIESDNDDDDSKYDSGVRSSDEDYGFESVIAGRKRKEQQRRDKKKKSSVSPVPPGLGSFSMEGGTDGYSDSSAAAAASLADWISLLKFVDKLEDTGLISMSEGLQLRQLASVKNDQLFVLFATYRKNDSRFLRHARALLDWNSVSATVAPADSMAGIDGDIIDPSAVGAVPAREGSASADGPAYFETDMLAGLIDEIDSD